MILEWKPELSWKEKNSAEIKFSTVNDVHMQDQNFLFSNRVRKTKRKIENESGHINCVYHKQWDIR